MILWTIYIFLLISCISNFTIVVIKSTYLLFLKQELNCFRVVFCIGLIFDYFRLRFFWVYVHFQIIFIIYSIYLTWYVDELLIFNWNVDLIVDFQSWIVFLYSFCNINYVVFNVIWFYLLRNWFIHLFFLFIFYLITY